MDNAEVGENTGGVEINNVNPKQGKRKNKWPMVVLIILVVAIVGLVIGILVVNLVNNNREVETEEAIVFDGEEVKCKGQSIGNDAEEISKCIAESYAEENNSEEKEKDVFDEYSAVISQFEEKGDYEKAAELIIEKFNYAYLYLDDCELPFELLGGENLDAFPKELQMIINSEALSLWIECGYEYETPEYDLNEEIYE